MQESGTFWASFSIHFVLGTYLLKSCSTFYDILSIAKDLSIEDMFKFSDIAEIQGQCECVTEENVSNAKRKWLKKQMTEVKQSLL